mmetsp:Transcript_31998/g.52189  ORF Transcript_31998/g.52189 Transcript_31998/m.52189 type:complete len:183 (+) Transcript_31998:138-686(+)
MKKFFYHPVSLAAALVLVLASYQSVNEAEMMAEMAETNYMDSVDLDPARRLVNKGASARQEERMQDRRDIAASERQEERIEGMIEERLEKKEEYIQEVKEGRLKAKVKQGRIDTRVAVRERKKDRQKEREREARVAARERKWYEERQSAFRANRMEEWAKNPPAEPIRDDNGQVIDHLDSNK